MAKREDKIKLEETASKMIEKASNLPLVRVNREEFLRKVFNDDPNIDYILEHGPQSVYTVESLRAKAELVIKGSTKKTSVNSFIAGVPSNPALALAGAGIDVTQYFGFAINLAQKIAYIFGAEDFSKLNSEEAQADITILLGTMLGVEGAKNALAQIVKNAGVTIGKRVARRALTKEAWYVTLKKILNVIGQKITKQTVQKTITGSFSVVGAAASSAITWVSFRPLGKRLANVYVDILNGAYDVEMEMNPEFAASFGVKADAGEVVDVEYTTLDEEDYFVDDELSEASDVDYEDIKFDDYTDMSKENE